MYPMSAWNLPYKLTLSRHFYNTELKTEAFSRVQFDLDQKLHTCAKAALSLHGNEKFR